MNRHSASHHHKPILLLSFFVLKCLSIVELNANLYNYAIYKTLQVRESYTKFPLKNDYFDYIEEIEKQIIAEMNLGYESAKDKDREQYYPTFRKDLKI